MTMMELFRPINYEYHGRHPYILMVQKTAENGEI